MAFFTLTHCADDSPVYGRPEEVKGFSGRVGGKMKEQGALTLVIFYGDEPGGKDRLIGVKETPQEVAKKIENCQQEASKCL